ncbi:hypothetical protein THRCLA_02629 [Thraustotheca clavata]|uniref:Uncharacterized protein n=1 Tax=Thraustotheca clavata TaxID=74557 RepID=A0A1W0A4H7_9STRA|nr:hypothetical protein THRCLA_02629 [Thraustotheca clavata]
MNQVETSAPIVPLDTTKRASLDGVEKRSGSFAKDATEKQRSASLSKDTSRNSSISKREFGSKNGIEIRAMSDAAKASEIVASAIVGAKDEAKPSGKNLAPTIKYGDRINLHAACPGIPGDGGVLMFLTEGKGKNSQRILAVPPTQGEAHVAEFVIAPVGGATSTAELCYNQHFLLQVVDPKGVVQTLNNDPPGSGECIGLQNPGTKGEMTCYFSKTNDNSKILYDEADLVLSVHDSHRTRKHFNNSLTYFKRLKGTPGGYISSAKKGTTVTFTVRQPSAVTPLVDVAKPTEAAVSEDNTSRTASEKVSDQVDVVSEPQLAIEINQPQAAYIAPEVVLSPAKSPPVKHESSEVHDDDVVKMDTKSNVIQHNEKAPVIADGPVIVANAPQTNFAAKLPLKTATQSNEKSIAMAKAKAIPPSDNTQEDDRNSTLKTIDSSKTSFSPRSPLPVVKEIPPVPSVGVAIMPLDSVPKTKVSFMTDSQQELTEIQQSVERLKKQRMQVEHIRHENERLEVDLMRERGDNRKLRQELERLHRVEADRDTMETQLASLESKFERLEGAYREKRQALADANEKRASLEKRWTQATDNLQHMIDETTKTYEAKLIAYEDDIMDREAKIQQQQELMDEMKCMHVERSQLKLEKKIERLEMSIYELEKKSMTDTLAFENSKKKHESEKFELEQKIATLVDTTTKQTAMIHECDRVICESEERMTEFVKRKNSQAKAQSDLEASNQALEQKLKILELETRHEGQTLSKVREIQDLEKQIEEKTTQIFELEEALAESERLSAANQRDMAVRERHRFHLDEINNELRKREKTFQITIAGLESNLHEVVNERKVLMTKINSLQDQLESERQDRARWASTRLRLLAQFCDEENKLSESLSSHGTYMSDLHH